ncbi:hypothetical protein HC928_24680, partial [bacterium]|nr:hypothetical protein [bacterium]
HRGDRTVIEVRDDGQGLDLAKIRAKAKQMGIATAELQQAPDRGVDRPDFEPGFSTAKEVSDLSGRGVGMDVVRTNLAAIGGTITVTTEGDRGTRFLLSVPPLYGCCGCCCWKVKGI